MKEKYGLSIADEKWAYSNEIDFDKKMKEPKSRSRSRERRR
jgi:hypothetical protein